MTGTKLITRPKLAAYLKGKGISIEMTANPFEAPDSRYSKAWFVPDNEEVRQLTEQYFKGGAANG